MSVRPALAVALLLMLALPAPAQAGTPPPKAFTWTEFPSDSVRAAWRDRWSAAKRVEVEHVRLDTRLVAFRTQVPVSRRLRSVEGRATLKGADAALLARLLARSLDGGGAPECASRPCSLESGNEDVFTLGIDKDARALRLDFRTTAGLFEFFDQQGGRACVDAGTRRDSLRALLTRALPKDARLLALRGCGDVPAGEPDVRPRLGDFVRVTAPAEALEKVPPDYPDELRDAGAEGFVDLYGLLGTDGRIEELVIDGEAGGFDASAARAVEQWKFRPPLLNGQPVAAWIWVPVKFTLH